MLGGAEPAPQALKMALRWGKTVVCADGGADWALGAKIEPAAVYGDLDSISESARTAYQGKVHHIAEQDSTDFDKALRHTKAPLVLGVGFTGGRIDHELGALTVLTRYSDRRCILIGAETITLLCPPDFTIELPSQSPVSLFPMAPLRCDSTGLHWSTNGLQFAPDGQIGTLNKVCAGGPSNPVRLQPDAPKMLLILPRSALGLTIEALERCAAQWPARAK